MAKIQKILNFILLVALCYQKPAIAANKTSFFPSSNSSLLEVTSDILIDVYDGPDIKTANKIGNVSLSKNEQTKVTSKPEKCSYDSECHLQIEFPDQGITLDLTLKHNSSRIYGYWEWSDLTIEGTVKGTPISASGNGHMEIHPKGTGFTHKDVDINCERDYTNCAPLQLSWACDNEKLLSQGKPSNLVGITFPGLQLQPFYNNGTTGQPIRFGFKWNCDPLLSIPVWTGLLIGIGLLLGFLWAIGMIASVNTPDKFDDPKGKQISVPQQD